MSSVILAGLPDMSAISLPFAVGPGVTRADIPALCAGLAALLRGRAGGGVVACDVAAVSRPDLVTVETLARLRLAARRHGWRLEVHGAADELADLVHVLGLSDILRC